MFNKNSFDHGISCSDHWNVVQMNNRPCVGHHHIINKNNPMCGYHWSAMCENNPGAVIPNLNPSQWEHDLDQLRVFGRGKDE